VNKLCEHPGFDAYFSPCMKGTWNACITLFRKVTVYHKLQVIIRSLLKVTKQGHKNMKAMKVKAAFVLRLKLPGLPYFPELG
jgi:hypothetical protein